MQPNSDDPGAGGGTQQPTGSGDQMAGQPGAPLLASQGAPFDINRGAMGGTASAADLKNAQAFGTTPASMPGMKQQLGGTGNPDQFQAMMQLQQQQQMNNYM